MDLAQFLDSKAVKTVAEPATEAPVSAEPLAEGATVYRDTTPSGIVVEYCPSPRWYRVNGEEVPSVTTVLGCLAKDGLSWWGMVQGVSGVLELVKRGRLTTVFDWMAEDQRFVLDADKPEQQYNPDADALVKALTAEKLTVNHRLNAAGDRGTNVHAALEQWAQSGGEFFPSPATFPDEERPYVEGLLKWVDALDGAAKIAGCEVMVGSAEHGFAGRFDLIIELTERREFVRKAYKRKDSVMFVCQPGRYLVDLKTSSGVYKSHKLQLAAYELASVECGYPATDGQMVLHISKDGAYEFVPSEATGADFLAVKATYDCLKDLP